MILLMTLRPNWGWLLRQARPSGPGLNSRLLLNIVHSLGVCVCERENDSVCGCERERIIVFCGCEIERIRDRERDTRRKKEIHGFYYTYSTH